jgi:hypothetical protein
MRQHIRLEREGLGDSLSVDDEWVIFIQLPPHDPNRRVAVHINELPFPTRGFGLLVHYFDDGVPMKELVDLVYVALDSMHVPHTTV